MPPDFTRRLLALAVPEAPVLAVATVLWTWEVPRAGLAGFFEVYPAIVLVAGGLLAWRFGRPRVLLALALLVLAERTLRFAAPDGALYAAVSLFLPLDLALLVLLPIRGIWSAGAACVLGAVAVEAVLMVVLRDPSFAGTAALLEAPLLPTSLVGWTPVPAPALLAFGCAAGVFGARAILRPSAPGRGFLWVLVASLLALDSVPASAAARMIPLPAFTYWLATAGLMFVVAIVETSYVLAFRDGLTGLPGRRAFDEALTRLAGPWTVAMVDVDRFKAVNDTHGHDVGDQVLRMVATALQQVEGGGRAYRYGGEEFSVLFPGRTAELAAPHLEALRATIERTPFVRRAPDRPRTRPERPRRTATTGRQLTVTVSIGYAEHGTGGPAAAAVVDLADQALYRAKTNGRNRVEGPASHGGPRRRRNRKTR